MKKTICVEFTYEINIPDETLTEESLAEFSKHMFSIKNEAELFSHVAIQIASNGSHFIEGLCVATEGIVEGAADIGYELLDIRTEEGY